MTEKTADILREIKKIPSENWDAYILMQDIFYRHYTNAMKKAIIDEAKKAGKRKADELQERKSVSPQMLIKELGLEVRIASEKEFYMPDSINLAEYHDGKIKISKKLLVSLEQNKTDVCEILGISEPYEVLFYHELYHFYEEIESENAGLSFQVRLFPFFSRTISPESAGEIAAYEFAKCMTGIRIHPYGMGLAGLYKYEPETVKKIIGDVTCCIAF